jgi:hypothetical protein
VVERVDPHTGGVHENLPPSLIDDTSPSQSPWR